MNSNNIKKVEHNFSINNKKDKNVNQLKMNEAKSKDISLEAHSSFFSKTSNSNKSSVSSSWPPSLIINEDLKKRVNNLNYI